MSHEKERLIRFLRRGPAHASKATTPGTLLLRTESRGSLAVSADLVALLARQGRLAAVDGTLRLAEPSAPDALGARPRQVQGLEGKDTRDGEPAVNWAESPLGQLMRRKGKNGAAFLTPVEFEAGERLRADFTRGQLSPRLGANWEASVSSGRRAGGVAELTDAALAARLRVEAAIRAVGPELSGVLLDVCCFLKGLEQVESERGWPVRSAKIVLKSALGALSRHYQPPRPAGRGDKVLHWGSGDYRPELGRVEE